MIEIEKPEGVLRYKHCDSCGSEEAIVAINVTDETTKIGTTVCICRDCAKLLGVGLLRITDGEEPKKVKITPKMACIDTDSESFKAGYREGYRDGFRDNYELKD